jgi:hypothetical protein
MQESPASVRVVLTSVERILFPAGQKLSAYVIQCQGDHGQMGQVGIDQVAG